MMREDKFMALQEGTDIQVWVQFRTQLGELESDYIREALVEGADQDFHNIYLEKMLSNQKVIVACATNDRPNRVLREAIQYLNGKYSVDASEYGTKVQDIPHPSIRQKFRDKVNTSNVQ